MAAGKGKEVLLLDRWRTSFSADTALEYRVERFQARGDGESACRQDQQDLGLGYQNKRHRRVHPQPIR